MNDRETKRQLISQQNRAVRELLTRWVLAYLQENGQSLYQDIARDLPTGKTGHLRLVGTALKRAGTLYVGMVLLGGVQLTVWSLAPIRLKRKQLPPSKGIGIDAEHQAWMQHWQLPRAERWMMQASGGRQPAVSANSGLGNRGLTSPARRREA